MHGRFHMFENLPEVLQQITSGDLTNVRVWIQQQRLLQPTLSLADIYFSFRITPNGTFAFIPDGGSIHFDLLTIAVLANQRRLVQFFLEEGFSLARTFNILKANNLVLSESIISVCMKVVYPFLYENKLEILLDALQVEAIRESFLKDIQSLLDTAATSGTLEENGNFLICYPVFHRLLLTSHQYTIRDLEELREFAQRELSFDNSNSLLSQAATNGLHWMHEPRKTVIAKRNHDNSQHIKEADEDMECEVECGNKERKTAYFQR